MGSRVLETGGYKGAFAPPCPRPKLHALITRHLGLPASQIVCEYGMSELSSQAYDAVAGIPCPRRGCFNSAVGPRAGGFPGNRPGSGHG